MRGNQGPMPQNIRKTDTLAVERAAHEACESKDYERREDESKGDRDSDD